MKQAVIIGKETKTETENDCDGAYTRRITYARIRYACCETIGIKNDNYLTLGDTFECPFCGKSVEIARAARVVFSENELREAFDQICNKINWKNPINAWIDSTIYPICAAATEFYTGSKLNTIGEPSKYNGWILVQADGYYQAIGA